MTPSEETGSKTAIKKKRHRYSRVITTVIIAVCAVTLLVSAVMLYKEYSEYKSGSDAYGSLSGYITTSKPEKPEDNIPAPGETPPAENGWPTVDFDALRNINPDISAWLICEDTPIHYPIVQGQDNAYYLNHLFDGTENKAGCLFIDIGNTPNFTDKNTVIYGHNMKDGSMFHALTEYTDKAYYDAHPRMLLLTPEGNYILELFAGYVADADSGAWKPDFANDAEFMDWIGSAREKSTFSSNVDVTTSDRVVTLSTCAYDFEDARCVVLGKLVPAARS